MTLLAICATPRGLRLGSPDGPAPDKAIAAAARALAPGDPIVILVHGKGYCPGVPNRDPHDLLLARRPGRANSRFVSWPRRLGFALGAGQRPRGLCLAFGWDARGMIWQAAQAALGAADALARLIQITTRAAPGRAVDLFGHSLGARVILGALPRLHAGAVDRVILLAAAEFRTGALTALASPAGQRAQFINVTSRENDLFDWLYERALFPLGAKTLGRGLKVRDNWLNIELDNPATEAGLRRLGLPLSPRRARFSHWSVYLRPGTFRLYRALLHDRQRLTLALLRPAVDRPPLPRGWGLLSDLPMPGVRTRQAKVGP